MKIIGIAGPPCSGKDTAAEYLGKRYGFYLISTGDLLRERARLLNLDLGRTSLQLLGTSLREENGGSDPLLQEALDTTSADTVLTGIRTVAAGEAILKHSGGSILYIESPLDERFARSVARDRDDHVSYEEFLLQDQTEHYGNQNIDTALFALRSMASRIITNDDSPEKYFRQLDAFIRLLD